KSGTLSPYRRGSDQSSPVSGLLLTQAPAIFVYNYGFSTLNSLLPSSEYPAPTPSPSFPDLSFKAFTVIIRLSKLFIGKYRKPIKVLVWSTIYSWLKPLFLMGLE